MTCPGVVWPSSLQRCVYCDRARAKMEILAKTGTLASSRVGTTRVMPALSTG